MNFHCCTLEASRADITFLSFSFHLPRFFIPWMYFLCIFTFIFFPTGLYSWCISFTFSVFAYTALLTLAASQLLRVCCFLFSIEQKLDRSDLDGYIHRSRWITRCEPEHLWLPPPVPRSMFASMDADLAEVERLSARRQRQEDREEDTLEGHQPDVFLSDFEDEDQQ